MIFIKLKTNEISSDIRKKLFKIASICPILPIDREKLQAKVGNAKVSESTAVDERKSQSWFGDRVAQLLVEHPLLVNEKKFDLRIFVVVRSFVPFEGIYVLHIIYIYPHIIYISHLKVFI